MSFFVLTVYTKLQLFRAHAAYTALRQLGKVTHYINIYLSAFIGYVVNLK